MWIETTCPDYAYDKLRHATDVIDAEIRLSKLRGKKVMLYFHPRDDTPGYATEACGFRDAKKVGVRGHVNEVRDAAGA